MEELQAKATEESQRREMLQNKMKRAKEVFADMRNRLSEAEAKRPSTDGSDQPAALAAAQSQAAETIRQLRALRTKAKVRRGLRAPSEDQRGQRKIYHQLLPALVLGNDGIPTSFFLILPHFPPVCLRVPPCASVCRRLSPCLDVVGHCSRPGRVHGRLPTANDRIPAGTTAAQECACRTGSPAGRARLDT